MSLRWANAESTASYGTSTRASLSRRGGKRAWSARTKDTLRRGTGQNSCRHEGARLPGQEHSDESVTEPVGGLRPAVSGEDTPGSQPLSAEHHPHSDSSSFFNLVWPTLDNGSPAVSLHVPRLDMSNGDVPQSLDDGHRVESHVDETGPAIEPASSLPVSLVSPVTSPAGGDQPMDMSDCEIGSPSSLGEWTIDTGFGGLQYQIFQSTGEQIAFSYCESTSCHASAYHMS